MLPRPTDKELEILRVLWQNGPGTVREVLKALNHERRGAVGYTTALKMLQIMNDKGLVDRDETTRPQIYRARLAQEETQRQLVNDLLERAFGGSAKQLVMHALEATESSDEDLERVERLLDRIEKARNENP
jgi:predicted transcriptional regulator